MGPYFDFTIATSHNKLLKQFELPVIISKLPKFTLSGVILLPEHTCET